MDASQLKKQDAANRAIIGRTPGHRANPFHERASETVQQQRKRRRDQDLLFRMADEEEEPEAEILFEEPRPVTTMSANSTGGGGGSGGDSSGGAFQRVAFHAARAAAGCGQWLPGQLA